MTKRIFWYMICSLMAVLFLFPLVWMLASSFKEEPFIISQIGSLKAFLPFPFTASNYADALRRVPLFLYALNSIVISGTIVAVGVIVNSMAGYALARIKFPGSNLIFLIVISLIIIPLESIIIPLFLIVNKFGWTDTYKGLIIPFIANAFSIFLYRQYFLGFPKALEDAARMDGLGTFGIYLRIAMPLAWPVTATVAIITFVASWNDFLWPLIITTGEARRPLQVGLSYFFHQPPIQWGDIMAFSTLTLIPMLIIFVAAQKYFVKGISRAGLKG